MDDDDDLLDPAREATADAVTVITLRSAPNAARVRLDRFITRSVENASRAKVQEAIAAGDVAVNGRVVTKSGHLVQPGDAVVCRVRRPPPPDIAAEDIPLDIAYEDEDVLVVNKPAGMVTHPAYGNYHGTLVNALLHYAGTLSMEQGIERAGIVHRLDKDTSGLLCVAKTDEAHRALARQFAAHTVEREYQAVVWGAFAESAGSIEAPIGRHRSDRKRMAVVEGGKEAGTRYEVLRGYDAFSLVALRLRTGRTHQIRVHLSHIRHPVFGDPAYGGRHIVYGQVTGRYKAFVNTLLDVCPRQALHARTLGFVHPRTRERVSVESPLPADMIRVIALLEEYYR
jgi:23S rRNA pseudouridine1911/1915/1917 synthase